MRLSSPRVPPLTDQELNTDQAEALAQLGHGPVLNIYRTIVHAPKAFTRFIAWGGYMLSRRSDLSPRERELAILRTGYRCQSGYEWAQHVPLGRAAGLTEDEIARIKLSGVEGWDVTDTAILRATDDLHEDQFIRDETWAALAKTFTRKQMMDLVFTVAQYTQVSMILNSFGVQLDEGQALDPDLSQLAVGPIGTEA